MTQKDRIENLVKLITALENEPVTAKEYPDTEVEISMLKACLTIERANKARDRLNGILKD